MSKIEVLSEITGTVSKVLVKNGDAVSEDESLMILESMKMEIPITAPEKAVVRELYLREGDQVAEGDVVAVLEA